MTETPDPLQSGGIRIRVTEQRGEYRVAAEPADAAVAAPVGRPWRCAAGRHVLGQVIRGNGVRRLHLAGGHVITGQAMIYCEGCSEHREWHSGKDGVEELLARRGTVR